MLNFIKKLFGFGKKEVKKAEEVLAETLSHFREDITITTGKTGDVTVNIGNKTKEEVEKIVSERMSELATKVTEVKEEVKEAVTEVVKKKKKRYYAPKPKKDAPKS